MPILFETLGNIGSLHSSDGGGRHTSHWHTHATHRLAQTRTHALTHTQPCGRAQTEVHASLSQDLASKADARLCLRNPLLEADF